MKRDIPSLIAISLLAALAAFATGLMVWVSLTEYPGAIIPAMPTGLLLFLVARNFNELTRA